jgi:hypothetical protein
LHPETTFHENEYQQICNHVIPQLSQIYLQHRYSINQRNRTRPRIVVVKNKQFIERHVSNNLLKSTFKTQQGVFPLDIFRESFSIKKEKGKHLYEVIPRFIKKNRSQYIVVQLYPPANNINSVPNEEVRSNHIVNLPVKSGENYISLSNERHNSTPVEPSVSNTRQNITSITPFKIGESNIMDEGNMTGSISRSRPRAGRFGTALSAYQQFNEGARYLAQQAKGLESKAGGVRKNKKNRRKQKKN